MSQKRTVPLRIISQHARRVPQVHRVVGQAFFRRPDLVAEPGHEREVSAVAAHQRHGGVRVAVHEPREEHVAGCVEHFVAGSRHDVRPEIHDDASIGSQPHGDVVEERVGDGECHEPDATGTDGCEMHARRRCGLARGPASALTT